MKSALHPIRVSQAHGEASERKELGSVPYQSRSTTRLDTDKTAKRCYDIYRTKNSGKPIRIFPPYQVMKHTRDEFNEYITKVAGIVDETARAHKNSGSQELWDDYDASRDRIRTVRVGDHGAELIKAAQSKLGGKMEIKTMNLGPHPTEPGKSLETLDWKETAKAAKESGVPNYKKELRDFYKEFYESNTKDSKIAKGHRTVNRTYKKSVDRARQCR